MNVLRSPPDKFPRNFPPFLDNMKRLTKFMHFIRLDNQSYSNFIKFFTSKIFLIKENYCHKSYKENYIFSYIFFYYTSTV